MNLPNFKVFIRDSEEYGGTGLFVEFIADEWVDADGALGGWFWEPFKEKTKKYMEGPATNDLVEIVRAIVLKMLRVEFLRGNLYLNWSGKWEMGGK